MVNEKQLEYVAILPPEKLQGKIEKGLHPFEPDQQPRGFCIQPGASSLGYYVIYIFCLPDVKTEIIDYKKEPVKIEYHIETVTFYVRQLSEVRFSNAI